MSADTNPHELIAQYRKAKVLAAYFITRGVTRLDSEASDTVRDVAGTAAGTASTPSLATWRLTQVIMDDYNAAIPR